MSKLLCRPHDADETGLTLIISPESAGWNYVGFEVYHLSSGQTLEKPTGTMEMCLVMLSGKADISSKQESWKELGDRIGIFENKSPYSVYLPDQDHFSVKALTDLELAVCQAPGLGNHPAKLIRLNTKQLTHNYCVFSTFQHCDRQECSGTGHLRQNTLLTHYILPIAVESLF